MPLANLPADHTAGLFADIFIAACYGPRGVESTPHVTLRKGYYTARVEAESLEEAAAVVRENFKELREQCPDTIVCREHKWNPNWWAADGFMGAHKILLDKIEMRENMPYWLKRDIQNKKNGLEPEVTEAQCLEAMEKYGTPWDGEDRFADIAHSTKIKGQNLGDVLEFTEFAVFLGKADKGQILKETPQLRVWCED